jgi:pimeloyl-ACP methyl ester carboxylesterase
LSAATAPTDPEIGNRLRHSGFVTNYHDVGEGDVVVLLHGSGPGVSAWANWRLIIPELSPHYRVLAPDIVGFGYTESDRLGPPDVDVWVEHIRSFLDGLGIERASLVGNSFGGALSLWLAATYPDLVDRLVLMGSVGSRFELTAGLDAVWGYQPSVESMEELLSYFVYNRNLLPPNLGELRFEASIKPGAQERWASLFPAPRQQWIDALALPAARLGALIQPTLLVHGRDDQVIPLDSSVQLLRAIDDATLHVFPHTGHWVQIERAAEFSFLVRQFLSPGAA